MDKLPIRRELIADPSARGERLDLFIARQVPAASRKAVKRALDRGMVFLDGRVERRAGTLLQGSEQILATLELPAAPEDRSELPILFRNSGLLAVNKPSGLPVHPTVAGGTNALDLVRGLLQKENPQADPVLLHRLDADTTGVLLFALKRSVNRELARQFAAREVEKIYLALVVGEPPPTFRVANHLRSGVRGRTVAVRSGGQPAATVFVTRRQEDGWALVEARPHTGRTHQIRAHLAGEGFPLLGDTLYGGPAAILHRGRMRPIERHLLHAASLCVTDPEDGKPLCVAAPLPADFAVLLETSAVT